MKLELKHLAPYLPYDLKMQYESTFCKEPFISIDKLETHNIGMCLLGSHKPILRPLSEIKEFLKERNDTLGECKMHIGSDGFYLGIPNEFGISFKDYLIIIENHFDVFGLIDEGLAIDMNKI